MLLGGLLVLLATGVALKVTWSDLMIWYRLGPDFALHRWKNARGYPEYRHVASGIIFVYLPGGSFYMGSPDRKPQPVRPLFVGRASALLDGRRDRERPRHTVTLSPFLMAKYEVSQSEWRRITGRSPSHFKGDKLPAESVSWHDCQNFCKSTGLALPTEAQWEYACRAGTGTLFAIGDQLSVADANFDEDFFDDHEGQTVRVDAYRPNGFGLFNLHGNVWEWCEDAISHDFYSEPDAAGPDPVFTGTRVKIPGIRTPSGQIRRVARGGGWNVEDWDCRSARRAWGEPTDRDSNTGLRPVFPMR